MRRCWIRSAPSLTKQWRDACTPEVCVVNGFDDAEESRRGDPGLRGRRVSLRPVLARDYEALLLHEVSDPLSVRWRLRGRTPAPEGYSQTLWAGVLTQFLVVANRDGRPVGLVTLYNVDLQNAHGYIAVVALDRSRSLAVVEGLLIFIEYVFAAWPLRKLCAESPEFNYATFSSGAGDIFVEEGRQREQVYYRGGYWDLILIAIFRSRWEERSPEFLPYISGSHIGATDPLRHE